ncbi:unnamed protein product [Rangifer tarandus platyrhynchus]|uniref:Uncharacterized protein n=2 Tax=Rangifer tarandus platyrhynchus TaxID=3082113 RepID=A0AC59YDJ2_RANTA|nr:unnamed protein product [Rangifer tarandus platyrhynchus]
MKFHLPPFLSPSLSPPSLPLFSTPPPPPPRQAFGIFILITKSYRVQGGKRCTPFTELENSKGRKLKGKIPVPQSTSPLLIQISLITRFEMHIKLCGFLSTVSGTKFFALSRIIIIIIIIFFQDARARGGKIAACELHFRACVLGCVYVMNFWIGSQY